MASKKQNSDANLDNLRKLLMSTEFVSLDDDLKEMVLDSLENLLMDEAKRNFGFMGKLFGNYSKNITLYITLIVVVLLIVVGLMHILLPPEYTQTTNLEFWQIIGPIITSALGYIFGAHSPKD